MHYWISLTHVIPYLTHALSPHTHILPQSHATSNANDTRTRFLARYIDLTSTYISHTPSKLTPKYLFRLVHSPSSIMQHPVSPSLPFITLFVCDYNRIFFIVCVYRLGPPNSLLGVTTCWKRLHQVGNSTSSLNIHTKPFALCGPGWSKLLFWRPVLAKAIAMFVLGMCLLLVLRL